MKKIGVWQFDFGTVRLYNADVSDTLLRESGDVVSFLGYIEVEVPKKTVMKEIRVNTFCATAAYPSLDIPKNATNVRILFDVEE